MIEDSKVEGKKVARPEFILGDEKFIWALMNWWVPGVRKEGEPVLNPSYVASCAKAQSFNLPLTSIVMINLSNNWFADYETPANDNQIKWIKNNLSVYTNSICVSFTNVSGTETPQNVGDKIRFFCENLSSICNLPVIAWISDTNMDLYPGEELPRGLEDQVLAMWYDKEENNAAVKPPAPTDYGAKNYFYVYDTKVLSRVSEAATAGYLGVSKLGGSAIVTPPVVPGDPGEDPGNPGTEPIGDSESLAKIAYELKRLNDWLQR
jgi:hypothetical protein